MSELAELLPNPEERLARLAGMTLEEYQQYQQPALDEDTQKREDEKVFRMLRQTVLQSRFSLEEKQSMIAEFRGENPIFDEWVKDVPAPEESEE